MFNQQGRKKNVIRSSYVGMVTNILKVLLGFGYRTLFIAILSVEYLGINGLFTNVLQILSLAELGITTAIVYRFYDPIKNNDVYKVGKLMNFFKRVYMIIALSIFIIGVMIMPFIPYLINTTDSLPEDINLYTIYFLFLINTISTYLFSYKLSLLNADQKNYVFSMLDLFTTFCRYLLQFVLLIITRDYTITLASGIATTIICNFIFSAWVTRQYRDVFQVKEMLEKEERRIIFSDTRACMYHKVGGCVLTGTDNVILTKFVNLAATGIYSNYLLIIQNLQNALGQLLGNYVSSLGNARLSLDANNYYSIFKKMNFLGMWITGLSTTCLFLGIDDFIVLWLGRSFVFDKLVTIVLCLEFFLMISTTVANAFTNASGLFVKDKIRPLIEAIINLIVSVVLTIKFGIIGVFLGTVISNLCTLFWRVPLVLYRYEFKRGTKDYWLNYLFFSVITVFVSLIVEVLFARDILVSSWIMWIVKIIVGVMLYNILIIAFANKKEEYLFVKNVFYERFIKYKKRGETCI